jgi:hypothetical protein
MLCETRTYPSMHPTLGRVQSSPRHDSRPANSDMMLLRPASDPDDSLRTQYVAESIPTEYSSRRARRSPR